MKKLIFVILMLLSGSLFSQTIDSTYVKAKVLATHDTDSWRVEIGDSKIWVRLWGIDGAEVPSPYNCFVYQEMGKETGDFVRSEVKGKEVYLKFMGTDIYKRPLVRVYFNGSDYNTQLVVRGFAWVVRSPDMDDSEYKILAEYKKLAFKNRLGIFINSKAITPALFRKRNRCSDKTDSK